MWKQPWPVYLVGFAAQSALLWFAAPLVVIDAKAPLAELPLRAAPIGVLVLFWGLAALVHWWREWRRNRRLIETLLAATRDEVDLDGDLPKPSKGRWWSPGSILRILKFARLEEKAQRQGQIPAHLLSSGGRKHRGRRTGVRDRASERLRNRLVSTLRALAKGMPQKRGKKYLHQLPWYVAVGTSGAGRGFALNDLQLQLFSLSHYQGEPLDGSGASTGCEWWFTASAVILDVGGGSIGPRGNDWAKLVTRVSTLRRRPLDGVIVACSLEQVLAEGQGGATVPLLLERIHKLQAHFAAPIPVYLLVTKTNHLEGFGEFFSNLGGKGRHEPWGIRLDQVCGDHSGHASPEESSRPGGGTGREVAIFPSFPSAFHGLVQKLRDTLPSRLHSRQEQLRRIRILAFPDQFASLEPAVVDLLQAFCIPPGPEHPIGQTVPQVESPEPAPLHLRGLFFVSANQPGAGTAIDRIIGPIGQRFGLPPWPPTPLGESEKNYFLGELFNKYLYPDTTLAVATPRREARDRWLRRLNYSVMALMFIAAIATWTYGSLHGSGYVTALEQEMTQFQQAYARARPANLDTALLPALDRLANVGKGIPRQLPWYMSLQRSAAARLRNEAEQAYRRLLETDFLLRIMARITQRLAGTSSKSRSWRHAATLYLMLGDWEPLAPEALKKWLNIAWTRELRNQPEVLDRLRTHLDALLSRDIPPLPLNEGLVEEINQQMANW